MAQKNQLTLQPPILGVNRRAGFQSQAPFSAYRATNTWPTDPLTGRSVIGTRPAIVPFASPTGSGAVNMLVRVNGVASGKPLQSMLAARGSDFSWYNASGTWTAATGAGASLAETEAALFPATLQQEVFIPQFDDKPWVFNYAAGTVIELVESAGTIPNDLRNFFVWQGALWGFGRLAAPHILYASRVSDAYDWDFAAPVTDTAGAYFSGGTDEGRLRGPITAGFALNSDTAIISTTEGLVALRAHPRNGGIYDDFDDLYILGQGAWCKVPHKGVFIMTRLGVYLIPFNGLTTTPVSPNLIPDELMGLAYDYADPTISMEYDSRLNGIWITDRGTTAPSPQAWFFDLAAGGFHQVTLPAYPYRLVEFFEAATENTSGVLFAGSGYSGLGQPDRVGAETFDYDLILGPFAISSNPTNSTKIVQARVTFGGDTPTIGGRVAFSVGATAEEAVLRAEDETHQFEVDLLELEANNGVCYPHVAGHAGTIRITQSGGRVTIEEITLTLVTAGVTRTVKYKTPSICQGYATATPAFGPDSALGDDDGVEIVDLSALPQDWWDLANTSGSNIRVTDASNNFIPFDVVEYSKSAETGKLWLKRALPLTPVAVRCWVCDQNVSKFPVGSPFGQYFAYPSWMLAVWPQGVGTSRTQLDWPLRHDFGSLPNDGPIAGNPTPVGGGEPESCPASNTEINYITFNTVNFTNSSFPLETVGRANRDDLDAFEESEPEDVIIGEALCGLEFTKVCNSVAGEKGDPANDSIVFVDYGHGGLGVHTVIATLSDGSLSLDLRDTQMSTSFESVRVRYILSSNTFEVYVGEELKITKSFGDEGEKPTYVNWRSLPPNMVSYASTINEGFATEFRADNPAANDVDFRLRKPNVRDSFIVNGPITDDVQDSINHYRAQLANLEDYWLDWTFQSAPDTNLDAEQS